MMASWKLVAVFVAATLTGCATKGDLQELRAQVAATESSAKASETSIKSMEEKLTAQDARLAEAEKSQLLAAKQQTEVAKQMADLEVRMKALDESIAKSVGRMDKNEAQITNLNNQANAWDTDLKLVKDEMVKLNSTVGKASTMYRKNLENMRTSTNGSSKPSARFSRRRRNRRQSRAMHCGGSRPARKFP